MQVFWIVFYYELLLSSRNLAKVFANFLFFIISVTIFFMLAQNQQSQGSALFYSITVIWFSLLSSLIFLSSEFLKKDFDDGTLEQVTRSVDNLEVFVAAKMIANWMVCALPILLAIYPLGLLIGLNSDAIAALLITVFIATLAINFICGFCGSLSILGNSAPAIAIIALPLIIPILLIAYSAGLEDNSSNLKILSGLCVFIACVSIFATAKIVKIAID